MKYWSKLSKQQRQERVARALEENVDFTNDASLGYPASKLDGKVFYDDAPFLKDAPVLQTFVANPNHIGCHTLGTSEKAFKGTQEMEREVLNVIAVDIFKAEPEGFDGYIAPGGTEANIEALWIYRNYFIDEYSAKPGEIAIIATEDTHYSVAKGANLLMADWIKVPVHEKSRYIDEVALEEMIMTARMKGKRYFIVMVNMGTTMFGSVDRVEVYTKLLKSYEMVYKVHVDAAYGGFVYPFSNEESTLNFENPEINSITIDAHKMLQAPYGTGIFVCRKGFIEYVLTKEAEYVEGMDLTLCGSRPGYNAVAVWTILYTYGPHGWKEKVNILLMRTDWLCRELDTLGIEYFREPHMNIVTLRAVHIPPHIAGRFSLVPQKHSKDNQWYKIVVMDHVEVNHLSQFMGELKKTVLI
ncbi:aspartate aminotransferase family protein [Flavobacterium cyanobacteriorum]|uniref:Aspartate aminotransferase family protein n=1 Tax=Flavobacterium cyanobacteriorum TaxID=2022802 RepID=A0A255ZBZ1_9FLAO|nr:pyridoxal-dependent decarboxylase [Flavobacterium cyanobacteriorum]OYQ38434.1 aspartate aminotransferase family protein [Flavobacterium cyanobacteriorum]